MDIRTLKATDPDLYQTKLQALYSNPDVGINITVSGLIKPQDDVSITSIQTVVGYTNALTNLIATKNNESEVVLAQIASPNTSVVTQTSFDNTKPIQQQYQEALSTLGYVDLNSPHSIHIYPTKFEDKEAINKFITDYNSACLNAGEDNKVITYADTVGDMMSSISLIISAITYILIAFVGVSLIVSSIMIGIITYISVIERTKEIGVLRSVGASKKDVKRVFTAESFIIGLASGVFGIAVAALLTIPINILLTHFTNISGIAALPLVGAAVLVGVSVVLTFIAGLIPAKVAAQKDPVIALRSE